MIFNGAAPGFGLEPGGLWLVLARSVSVAGLLQLFGVLIFRQWVCPSALARATASERAVLNAALTRSVALSLALAIGGLLLWLPLQSADIASVGTLTATLAAIPSVLRDTRFGHVLLAQFACLTAATMLWRAMRPWSALLLAGAALVLHAGHSHAASMQPLLPVLIGSDIIHLLAAGGWLGALLPLLAMVRIGTPVIGAAMCRYYSPLGKLCVTALLASAVVQFGEMIGGVPRLVGTGYGWLALAKMALFAVLFACAWRNRYRLAPGLRASDPQPSRRALIRSIGWQTAAGVAVVFAASMLSQLPPAMHTQPVWPFTEQFSLVTINEDADLRDEVLQASALLLVVIAMAGLGVAQLLGRLGRHRWPGVLAIALAIPLAVVQAGHLDLLFVPAGPESFYTSPTGFSAESIAAGATLYTQNCVSCHGSTGRGDGLVAHTLPIPPADLTAPHLWAHTDGELFGWIAHGMANPRGGLAMPGFSDHLSDDDIWALIDFIRARNPATPHDSAGRPIPPPDRTTMHHDM